MRRDTFPRLDDIKQTIWLTRPDLRQQFADNPARFDWWLLLNGATEYRALAEIEVIIDAALLTQPAPEAFADLHPSLTRFMRVVWAMRPDLQPVFDIRQRSGQAGFIHWYFQHGLRELQLDRFLTEEQRQWWNSVQRVPISTRTKPRKHRAPPDLPFGVNLIGYAKGQLGIGEDVRMAALALQAAGIPFSIYNVEPGCEVCQNDESAVNHISSDLPYAINLFCTTGIEMARLAAVEGSKLFDGRRSIGHWPWELPEWPANWHHAYGLVDELWAASRFTYDAYVRSCPKPVHHMPMAVTVDPTAQLTRRNFGLPEQPFLFVFAFDGLSSLIRKNPLACVQAFRTAFPRGDEPVGLVIKVMRTPEHDPQWHMILEAARADRRLFILSGTLQRAELLDLYRVCDSFISLHRSEGFGRGLAEAMLLGKPVIATGYSGNLDFTILGSAALVDYQLRPVAEGEYPFAEGLVWAEPDTHHAAWWMRRFVFNASIRTRLAVLGQQLAQASYSPEHVGAFYLSRLQHSQ
ncbi:Glycosyl transferases group 1 [Allochromatium warmingii]|uniref:Glycosyl transferases group 1 n=1 Tax=Allochromatium warmingii TaxID=61595 RepID=A0A1H3E5I1_ALLWA|nr:glycosyltransferase [Allochromatium warmingii]SDX73956.1 Glycosyl transferases group 1 [Allochromatium warmingii]